MRAATWVMKKLKKLWFLDESGVYLGMTCRYGWAATHMRVRDSVPTNYGTPWTMIAMIGVRGLHAPWLLEGAMHGDARRWTAMDGDAFATYVGHVACPVLPPGDIVIMDNLSAHKRSDIASLIQACGARARIEYLPPYSPDFNPIELCWSKLKHALRCAKAKTAEALLSPLAEALRSVSIADILHWLRHCGYASIYFATCS
jgi:transposase